MVVFFIWLPQNLSTHLAGKALIIKEFSAAVISKKKLVSLSNSPGFEVMLQFLTAALI